jgi:phosphoglycolate phosphatase
LAGVEKLLSKLIKEGYLLGLVTGNLEAAGHIKLHRAQLNRLFSFGGYGSDSTDRCELTTTALKRAALVYDEPVTLKCLGVGSHHLRVDQLRDSGADSTLASLEEALQL